MWSAGRLRTKGSGARIVQHESDHLNGMLSGVVAASQQLGFPVPAPTEAQLRGDRLVGDSCDQQGQQLALGR